MGPSLIAGRYTLEREIGRGGTGPVWLGRDEVLQREVAMKRIGLMPGDDEFDQARAEREARLSARVQDAHVVQVYDVVVGEDDHTHWLVMEYVDGASLGELVKRRGRFTPSEAIPLLAQIAGALVVAHEAGIVHRDIKPGNVLVDQQCQAKLTDFGIARLGSDPALTQTGLLTGSPAYLAPEVAAGGTGSTAADVWSFGAMAFHLLAGRAPYDVSDNVLGTLYRIVNDEVPRLPEDLSDAGPLRPLLAGTMVKDPERRWSMTQVRDFLHHPDTVPEPVPGGHTQLIAPAAATSPARRGSRSWLKWALWLCASALALGLAMLLGSVLALGGKTSPDAESVPTPSKPATPTRTTTPTRGPTVEGMENFIRDYVRKVGEDPARSWPMLTPRFQRESGGFETYRAYWDKAREGRIDSISANPEDLMVRYDVRWKGHPNGPTTVLQLSFDGSSYLIAGELTRGFHPDDG